MPEELKKKEDCPFIKGKLIDVWEWANGIVISVQTDKSDEKSRYISQNYRLKSVHIEADE